MKLRSSANSVFPSGTPQAEGALKPTLEDNTMIELDTTIVCTDQEQVNEVMDLIRQNGFIGRQVVGTFTLETNAIMPETKDEGLVHKQGVARTSFPPC